LKAGTKSFVKRISITGINPRMLNDLTSGFNMQPITVYIPSIMKCSALLMKRFNGS